MNRLIGYGIVRQVREEIGTCKTDRVIRDQVESCTGNGGIDTEDSRDYCLGWVPETSENCTVADEYRYTTADELDAISFGSAVRTYGGGGYLLRMRGYILDLRERSVASFKKSRVAKVSPNSSLLVACRIEVLKTENWVDNRTRALIAEFSVYNAQVNLFSLVTCVAEFVGGGVVPYYNIDVFRLFPDPTWFGTVVTFAEVRRPI